jgi:hypothetical protein
MGIYEEAKKVNSGNRLNLYFNFSKLLPKWPNGMQQQCYCLLILAKSCY